MPLIQPFAGLRPAPGYAAEVAAPPYDVVSIEEARRLVKGRPWSFLHISRAEVDLPPDIDPYDPSVYQQARIHLDRMRAAKVLIQDLEPRYYVYRLTLDQHSQTGLVVAASVAAYRSGRIKRHELTRPVKEDDRVRQIQALGAQTGPVFLFHRAQPALDQRIAGLTTAQPEVDFTASDGVRHQLWSVSEPKILAELTQMFEGFDSLYIADGHHRAAAGARVAELGAASGEGQSSESGFLAVVFPHDQLRILDYNRLVRDLNGLDAEGFIAQVDARFVVEPSMQPVAPERSGVFGMYLQGRWYRLTPRFAPPADDPVAALDVSLIQDHLLGPILGITDPRKDERIDFVGGVRGLSGLTVPVDAGEMAVAFALHPPSIESLMAIADRGQIMPPKSTWFEPKLADGLVSLVL
ncbi:DUF1015 domain-containing protein [Caldichromatium japonicum]|uniref:DUF1015 domain-containing protein n=1 Tax=Caldichromatium japonicum TaxID=2699430 RepID=A0A6G7VDJ1_9GAMM|nr:DUF1015 family protein [Caldichromatium japonicum]QIK38022.1 DUF1015 domain-containing protein [Caldichromatium japonicum]